MLCIRGTSHVPVSVRLSVTSRCSIETAERIELVFGIGAERPGFKSQSRRCRLSVLGKLFTPNVPLFTKQRNWQQPS